MRPMRAFAVAVVLSLATACRDSTTGTPTADDALSADVAVVAGDAAYEDVGVIYSQLATFGVPTGEIGRVAAGAGCPWVATTGRFECPTIEREGRTMSRSYAFRDAAGNAQSAFDAVTTESANFRSTMSGAVTRERWSATISHERDFTRSGLAGAETQHTINGVGSSAETRSRHTDGGVRSYSMSTVATFANVVVPFPRARGMWPLSGTVTRVVTASRDDAELAARTRTATTTFNGTRFATMVVGDRTFSVDLATGRVVRGR